MTSILFRPLQILAMIAGLAFGAGPALAAPAPFMGDEVSVGNAKAKVTVIEYASLSCPHCAWVNNAVFPLFKAKYLDTGKVRYVFRELLTPPTEFAGAGYLIARCAGENRYLAVVDAIFHDQDKIFASGDLIGGLHAVGQRFGLAPAEVDACIKDPKAVAALEKRMTLAEKAGVSSVPTFFINGVKKEGEQSLGDLDVVIEPMLAK